MSNVLCGHFGRCMMCDLLMVDNNTVSKPSKLVQHYDIAEDSLLVFSLDVGFQTLLSSPKVPL